MLRLQHHAGLALALLLSTGCWHTSHSGQPPWPHILTCYGGCSPPHYDPSACGGSTACCSHCIDGTWWYSTEQQIFGCGAKLEIRKGDKCVVVQVADNGPASWVENKAAGVCGGSGDIIDASPLVADYFGGGCGWSQCFWVQVRPVSSSLPQGICPTCPCGGECKPGQVQSAGCGNCGTKTRTCQGNGKWGGWSGCGGQGVCAPGQSQQEPCGDCGTHGRTCKSNCQWAGWSACSGPDPQGGNQVCDSGALGACAEGRMRCLAGWLDCVSLNEPSPELCDGLDNDCEGEVDNGAPEVMGVPPPVYAAIVSDLSFPSVMEPLSAVQAWADFRNVGSAAWKKGEIWLMAQGPEERASPFWAGDDWPAWDVASQLEADTPPGEVGRFAWQLRAPGKPGVLWAARFYLAGPDGKQIMCPSPDLQVSVRTLGPAGRSSGSGADSLSTPDEWPPPRASVAGRKPHTSGGCGLGGPTPAAALLQFLLLASTLLVRAGGRRRRGLHCNSLEPVLDRSFKQRGGGLS